MKMRFAYADPPYYGCSARYDHPNASDWDEEKTHRDLITRLMDEFKDGWAASLSVPSISIYISSAPSARLCAWVKPFASFKPNVPVAYTWEPVLLYGGRRRTREEPTCRDHLSEGITIKRGLCGAKPLRFNQWIMGLLNWKDGDEIVDLFPGTGSMEEAISIGIHDLGGPRKK